MDYIEAYLLVSELSQKRIWEFYFWYLLLKSRTKIQSSNIRKYLKENSDTRKTGSFFYFNILYWSDLFPYFRTTLKTNSNWWTLYCGITDQPGLCYGTILQGTYIYFRQIRSFFPKKLRITFICHLDENSSNQSKKKQGCCYKMIF